MGFLLPFLAVQAWASTQFRFERISPREGLTQNSIFSILQDHQGFMWFGTENGLNRYDGYRFTSYVHDPMDPATISASTVICLYEDRSHTLWAGTLGGGLNRFDRQTGSFTSYRSIAGNLASISHDEINVILEDDQGALWIGTRHGLNQFDRDSGRFRRFYHDPANPFSLNHNDVLSLYEDRRGELWVGTKAGLNRYDRKLDRFRRQGRDSRGPSDEQSPEILSIHQSGDGVFWLGTRRGVLRLAPKQSGFPPVYQKPPPLTSLNQEEVLAIHEDRDGTFWFGTKNGGLSRYDPKTGRLVLFEANPEDPHALPHNCVLAIVEDRAGLLWIGTLFGLSKFNRQAENFGLLKLKPAESGETGHNLILSILEDAAGSLWVGTYGDGLKRLNRGPSAETRHYLHDPHQGGSISSNHVWTLHEDEGGDLWVGTTRGLGRLDRNEDRFVHYRHRKDDPGSLSDNLVYTLYEDRGGVLWVGTGKGLNRLEDPVRGTFNRYTHVEDDPCSLSPGKIWALHEDRRGDLWVGTFGGGLNRLVPSGAMFQRYRADPAQPGSLSSDQIWCIHEDREGILWIGTSSGLNRLDPSDSRSGVSFTHYRKKDGLVDDLVYGILDDGAGHLWMSTNQGLARFNPRTESFHAYDVRDGLQGNEYNAGAYFRSPSGELFFGGVNGLNAFFPERIDQNALPPPVVITDFNIIGNPARQPSFPWNHPDDQLVLNYQQDIFSFEFAALDFASPEKNRYAYKLEGFDKDWHLTDAENRKATYTRIRSGSYVFRVKGSNGAGVWNETGARVGIKIMPPPWKTWWALSLYGLGIAAILFGGGQFLWYRKLLAINRELDEKVEVKTREVRELHQLKTRFFTNISHEFRTPLTLIAGPLEDLIAAEGKMPEGERNQLTRVLGQTRQLGKLIDQLLDVSKLEAGQMMLKLRRGNLVDFVNKCVLAFASWAERKGIALLCRHDDAEIAADYDADKLEKILWNLLSNALKFTGAKGKILVTVGEAGDEVFISVKDTGPGISEDRLAHVFDRFFQGGTNEADPSPSTGIGLSLARELALLHGGDISVQSEPGFGSEFRLRIPRRSPHAHHPEREETVAMPRDSAVANHPNRDEMENKPTMVEEKRASVLIVEDHPELGDYLREALSPDYRVLEARDGEQGLRLAREQEPDLIVSDVMMPKMDGIQLCAALKGDARTNHIPIVLLTVKDSLQSKVSGWKSGADDYLTKPFSATELKARLENLRRSRQELRARFSDEMVLLPSNQVIDSADQVFLNKARDVVERHFGDHRFQVQMFAEEMGLSVRHLRRKFQVLMGMGPAAFIRGFRLEYAARLLKSNAGSVAEIAYLAGFATPRHFAKLFRRAYKQSPSEFAANAAPSAKKNATCLQNPNNT